MVKLSRGQTAFATRSVLNDSLLKLRVPLAQHSDSLNEMV
jgi:hypothetical protein